MRAIREVLVSVSDHEDTWKDKPESFWMARLTQEISELGLALIDEHQRSPEYELTQIAAIAINWLAKRREQSV